MAESPIHCTCEHVEIGQVDPDVRFDASIRPKALDGPPRGRLSSSSTSGAMAAAEAGVSLVGENDVGSEIAGRACQQRKQVRERSSESSASAVRATDARIIARLSKRL